MKNNLVFWMTLLLTYPNIHDFPTPQGVLVGGCFDILHYGHLTFLKSARLHGSHLIVALESDESIIQRKHILPIHTQSQRAEILAELKCVDHIILLPIMATFEDYLALVQWVNPLIIAVTEGDAEISNKERQARSIGAELKIVNPLIPGLSSRKIREKTDRETLLKIT